MTASITIAEAQERILAQPAPILFLDTCALLDVLRVASDEERVPHRIVPAAIEIVAKAIKSPRELWSFGAARLDVEWKDNIRGVLDHIEKHIARVDRSLVKLHAATRAVSPVSMEVRGGDFRFATARSALQIGPIELPRRLTEVCEAILRILIRLSLDADILRAAERRIMEGLNQLR